MVSALVLKRIILGIRYLLYLDGRASRCHGILQMGRLAYFWVERVEGYRALCIMCFIGNGAFSFATNVYRRGILREIDLP